MRAFVALEISGRVAEALAAFQKSLPSTGADVKLVERENLHLNLKFLGEISESQASEVGLRLKRISVPGAEVDVRGAGAFPSSSRPRVVWAGMAREHEGLVVPIADEVERLLQGIGERDDRPYRPHITLGRVRSFRNLKPLEELLLENSDREFGLIKLAEVKLKSSQLTPGGPVYTDLGVYPLG